MNKNRKLNRLKDFDYASTGIYFVTLCTKKRLPWFGEVINGQVELNDTGIQCRKCWLDIPKHFPHIIVDDFIIMPDHLHGILRISAGNNNYCSLRNTDIAWQTKWGKSISSAIRGFKIGVKKLCKEIAQDDFEWQKSYHDRIIRTEKELHNVREYIKNNPENWTDDVSRKEK